jgi:hypothetical protein
MKVFNFKDFVLENIDTDVDNPHIEINEEDIIEVIESGGSIYTNIVDNYPTHDEDEPLTPISIDDGDIIVDIDGELYTVDLKFVKRYEL